MLLKRLERYKKAEENRQLVDAQTETVLEVLQLLRDQSYSMRDPREITEQLDGLVSAAEETERGVKDMEEMLSTEDELLMGGNLAGLELGLGSADAVTGASVPVSRPVLEENPEPRAPVKETHVSGRFRAMESARPMPPVPPPLPPRKKVSE